MSELTGPPTGGLRRPAWRRWGVPLGLAGGAAVLVAAGGLALRDRPLHAPRWVADRVEAAVNNALEGHGRLALGAVDLVLDHGWRPRFRLSDITLFDQADQRIGTLADLRFRLRRDDLLALRLRPDVVEMGRATMYLRRLPDGRLDLDVGQTGAAFGAVGSMAEIMAAIDDFFEEPLLSGVIRASAREVGIRLEDQRVGQVWEVSDGRLTVRRDGAGVRVALDFDLGAAGERPAAANLLFETRRGTPEASFSARLTDVPARDVALQAPALAWLSVLDAPLSGEVSARIDGTGALLPVRGKLSIGPGAVQPEPGTPPVRFRSAVLALAYDAAAERVSFEQINVQSRTLRFSATGQAFLREMEGGFPAVVEAQIAVSDMRVDPDGVFEAPVGFSDGQADLQLRLDPLTLAIGQATLSEGSQRLRAFGRIAARPDGWEVALDTTVNEVDRQRLIALWPVSVAGKTREWLSENVFTANLSDVKAAVRLRPGEEPRLGLTYEFRDGEVGFMPTLPPIRHGSGYAAIDRGRYAMRVNAGQVDAPKGGTLDVAGSTFVVPDIEEKPARAEIDLQARGSITAALSVLDEPPFRFLSKAEKPVDLAEGRADVRARIALPLLKDVKLPQVEYHVAGVLSQVRSDRIVPGRALEAAQLDLTADRDMLRISGAGRLSGVPFQGAWEQPLDKAKSDLSRVTGWVELSPAALAAFAPGLPETLVSGRGRADVQVDLAKGAPPAIRLESDLAGLGLRLPEIGWQLSPAQKGRLALALTAGKPAEVRSLSLTAPGLMLEGGRATLKADDTLGTARFSRVRAGDWLDAPVVLTGQGRGRPPAVSLPGGHVNLAALPDGGGGARPVRSAAPSRGSSVPITFTLDRVDVGKELFLTNASGALETGGGIHGTFRGLVNGVAGLTGEAIATGGRPALRFSAKDAGALIAAMGITPRAAGGALSLSLTPRAQAGEYDGQLAIEDMRLREAPVLAQLLSAVSVVGLVEQLAGGGILFSDIRSDFRLTPGAVEVKSGSATGPSLGISAAGVYLLGSRRIEMQGVVSPLYLLNGIGAGLTRRGEGLIGINYTVSGTADDPRIGVNPLSIFTPGMFRELFRSDPPRLAQ
ncbi:MULTISPECIES: AsmA-like C-terminal region-containing protein [unclassified Haematobacter]|uniref:YhdP family protein n=1 Tax=unclassified Haematobacter TaxID=2640585 RepID=UPI0025C68CEF|nr:MULTISPECIES: AsmA-like C-terminal region-containing protein [unclassified Haematobacter]